MSINMYIFYMTPGFEPTHTRLRSRQSINIHYKVKVTLWSIG